MILEAIYSGDFYPSETVVPKSKKYRNALKACEKIMDRLAEKLSKEDYDLVEELQDQASIAQCGWLLSRNAGTSRISGDFQTLLETTKRII